MYVQEKLTEGNQLNCSSCCHKTNTDKSLTISNIPPILIVYLKRFYQFPGGKNTCSVTIPITLTLPQNLYPTQHPNIPTTYKLYASSNHIQLGEFLHYTSYCNIPTNTSPSNWYLFNDDRVTSVGHPTLSGPDPYILFYRRHIALS